MKKTILFACLAAFLSATPVFAAAKHMKHHKAHHVHHMMKKMGKKK